MRLSDDDQSLAEGARATNTSGRTVLHYFEYSDLSQVVELLAYFNEHTLLDFLLCRCDRLRRSDANSSSDAPLQIQANERALHKIEPTFATHLASKDSETARLHANTPEPIDQSPIVRAR